MGSWWPPGCCNIRVAAEVEEDGGDEAGIEDSAPDPDCWRALPVVPSGNI